MIEKKTAAFRVDASLIIGKGHVARCLTLAKELKERGVRVIFICRNLLGGMKEEISREGYAICLLKSKNKKEFESKSDPAHAHWLGVSWREDAEDTSKILKECVEWLIVDHYGIDYRWHEVLRNKTKKILVIDDIADRKLDCDVVINQTYPYHMDMYQDLLPATSIQLLGTHYAILRQEFSNIRTKAIQERKKQKKLERILLVLGGGQQGCELTALVLSELLEYEGFNHVVFDVVLSYGDKENREIKKTVTRAKNVNWHENTNNISKLMKNSSISITSAGGTTWERICLGVFSFVIVTAEHQKKIARTLCDRGYEVCLGEYSNYSLAPLFNIFKDSCGNTKMDNVKCLFKPNFYELVDGEGVKRIVDVVLSDELLLSAQH